MSFYIKAIFLLSFVWGTFASQELDGPIFHADCPRIDDINHVVMLPYAPDCSKYYRCLNGQAYLQQCPYNLYWSAATYRCDRPEIAQCQAFIEPIPVSPIYIPSRPEMTYQPSIVPIPITPTIPTPYPFIPNNPEITYQRNPNDCSKYYQCQAQACPSNLYWNSYTKQCDYPQNVQCTYSPLFQLADGTATGSK